MDSDGGARPDIQRGNSTSPPEQVPAAAGGAHGAVTQSAPAQPAAASDPGHAYTTLEEMLAALLERARAELHADTAAVLLLDEDRGMLVARAARGLEEEVRQGVRVPLARGFAGRVAAQARPIVIEDLDQADVVNPILRQRGIRSMLGVPLQAEGRVIGVMHVGTLRRREFGAQDTAALQLAADRAALAIDRARQAERRAVTEIMQRTLLPDALPEVPGVRFSAKYLPAGTGVKIGGDWYDVMQMSDGRLALVIGDVVGRGVLAAAVMSEIRTALRAYLSEGHGLAEVMSLLNDLLVAMGRDRSATATILALDLEREELEAVSAAHLPALTISPDGSTGFLEQHQGLPLGISAGQHYTPKVYPFPVNSTLLLYTDGLIERRGESIEHGLARLRAAAEREAEPGDASLADCVYRELLDQATLEDDVALLAIELLPLGPRMQLTLDANTSVLAGLRRTLGRWLSSQGVRQEDLFGVTLAASEAAGNAIEHAYGGRQASFTVTCERDDTCVRVIVHDDGVWRETRSDGGGRGLGIMHALVDSAEIERGEHGTTVTLSKRLPESAP